MTHLSLAVALGCMACGTPPPASVGARRTGGAHPRACHAGLRPSASKPAQESITSAREGVCRGRLSSSSRFGRRRLRMDIIGPMNVGVVATLTRRRQEVRPRRPTREALLFGPASACNIARLTPWPMPGHVLSVVSSVARRQSSRTDEKAATIAWSSPRLLRRQDHEARVTRKRRSTSPLTRSDFGLPWQQQRMRVVEVEDPAAGHRALPTRRAERPPTRGNGKAARRRRRHRPAYPGERDRLPSRAAAQHPREVPGKQADVLFRYEDVAWNPPLTEGLFTQPVPGGMQVERVTCDE